jgi:Family of unknown function (DUF6256)
MSSALIRQDLVPMVVGYVLIMGALAIGLLLVRRSAARSEAAGASVAGGQPRPARTPAAEPGQQELEADRGSRSGRLGVTARVRPGWLRLGIHSLATAVGGYLVLMAVIILYYVGVRPPGAGNSVDSAFSGCAMLIGLAAPVFLALSWLADLKGWRL